MIIYVKRGNEAMEDIFNLTKEQNIFLAKKVLVSNIYNSAKLEGINTASSDTKLF